MDGLPEHYVVRPDPAAEAKRPALIAEAIAARLKRVLPVASIEPGGDFDRACREQLAKIESHSGKTIDVE